MEAIIQDLRYGFRTLVRGRSFTIVAVLTLAIALGANSAIFTLVNAILLTPLPYAHPDRVLKVMNMDLETGRAVGQHSYPNIVDMKLVPSLEEVAAYTNDGMFLTEGDSEPELLVGTAME